jgi:hypothetical protein
MLCSLVCKVVGDNVDIMSFHKAGSLVHGVGRNIANIAKAGRWLAHQDLRRAHRSGSVSQECDLHPRSSARWWPAATQLRREIWRDPGCLVNREDRLRCRNASLLRASPGRPSKPSSNLASVCSMYPAGEVWLRRGSETAKFVEGGSAPRKLRMSPKPGGAISCNTEP